MTQNINQLAVNTLRTLSIDAINAANSGHPGSDGSSTNGLCIMGESFTSQS